MATNMKRKKKAEVMEDDGSMTLTGHLKELRNRLIICAVVFVVGVVVSLAYADRLIDLLTAMGRDYYQFVSIAPHEKLMLYFRVSILAGVIVTVPVAFYRAPAPVTVDPPLTRPYAEVSERGLRAARAASTSVGRRRAASLSSTPLMNL